MAANSVGHARIGLGAHLNRTAVLCAYLGGVVISAVGIMSVVSIIARSALGRPITGDFELVEIGTAIAGTLFLPYCQATHGHIAVDLFTQRVSPRARDRLDRFGSLLMAVMFIVVAWRAVAGGIDIRRSGETSMLMGVPIWVGYAAIVPGATIAGVVALAQALGIQTSEARADG